MLLNCDEAFSGSGYFCVTWKQNVFPVRCIFSDQSVFEILKHLCKGKKVLTPLSLDYDIGRTEESLQMMAFAKTQNILVGLSFYVSLTDHTSAVY